jgi:hypothetical protein
MAREGNCEIPTIFFSTLYRDFEWNLARNVTPCKHSWVFFRAKFHSKSLYSVEKKIVGISQYAYFRLLVSNPINYVTIW